MVGGLVADALEALAFELGELDAVGGVADVEVKDGAEAKKVIGAYPKKRLEAELEPILA